MSRLRGEQESYCWRSSAAPDRVGGSERAKPDVPAGVPDGSRTIFDWWGAEAGVEPFGRSLVSRYPAALEARELAPRTLNLRLAAVRKLAEEAAAENLLAQGKVAEIRSVKGARFLGGRVGNWLTKAQAEKLLGLPDRSTLKGKRDFAVLCLFLTGGLRREELASLHVDQNSTTGWPLVSGRPGWERRAHSYGTDSGVDATSGG